ncbi:uncharacterized protein LOC115989174 isoform X2 [Quercus lobata]|uniref:uncharacterized protein LOC115989174 isoform X2 n=1 Tax=Quercus lobata TaxID=97700 RepID=UPI001248B693|nr:uncharacterized protein LOC115989174 isoform X2 [Quercus lobata]
MFSSLKFYCWIQTQSHIVLLKTKKWSLSHVIFCHVLTHLVLQKDTRLVAALDAMRPYGFPQDFVEVAVRELLNVYGGNEGWVFIEDSSYSVLVETLLEKTNAPQDQKDDSPQHDPGDADNKESSAVGPSTPTCSNSGATDAMLLTNQALDSASQPNEAPDSAHESHGMRYLPPPQAASSGGAETFGNSLARSPPHIADGLIYLPPPPPPAASSGGAETLGNSLGQSPPRIADGMHYLPRPPAARSGGAETLGNSLGQSPSRIADGMRYLPWPPAASSGRAETLGNSLAQSPPHIADGMHYLPRPLEANSGSAETLGKNLAQPPPHIAGSMRYLPPPLAASSGGAATIGKSFAQSPPHVNQSPLPDIRPTRRRRPYHGWISNDEEIDLVQLTPAPLPEGIAKLLRS